MNTMAWWEGEVFGSKPALVSNNFWSFVGYNKEEIGERRTEWINKVFKEDQERVLNAVKHDIWEIEFRLHQKNGSPIWLRETGRWTLVENDKPKEIYAMVKNITIEKKSIERMEAREKESALIAKETMALCPIALALFQIKDSKLKLLEINETGIKMWNLSSYQDAAENLLRVINDSIPDYQPSGMKSIPLIERVRVVMKEGSSEFSTFMNIRGEKTKIKFSMKKIELPSKTLAAVYVLEEDKLKLD